MLSKIFLNKKIIFFILKKNNLYYIIFFLKNKKIILIFFKYFYFNKIFYYIEFITKNKKLKKIFEFLYVWNNFFIKKIKVRHKISWLKIYRKKFFLIKINYGFSFKSFFFFNNLFFKKKKIYMKFSKIIFWNLNNKILFEITKNIRNYRYLDQYTLRGFKFSQQKFLKRVGKISKFKDFKKKIF